METIENNHGTQSHEKCISYKTDERNITHYSINDNRICYSYYGIYYANSFQEEWALNHLPKTGPHECLNCLYYGTYKGIFIEYCLNCSNNEYNGCRTNNINGNMNPYSFDVINLSLFHSLHILKKNNMVDMSDILDMNNDKYDALIDLTDDIDSENENETDVKSFNTDDLYSHNNDTDNEFDVEQLDDDRPIVLNYDEINQYVDPRDKYQFEEEYYGYCADSTSATYGSNYDGGYDSH